MGRRGIASQRSAAAVSACAHARRTIGRLLIAGAFCLAGWAVLAALDASPVAASERPAASHRLDTTTIADEVRAAADRAASATRHRPSPSTGRGTAVAEQPRRSEQVADRAADAYDQFRSQRQDTPVGEALRDAKQLTPSDLPYQELGQWPEGSGWPGEVLPGGSDRPGDEPQVPPGAGLPAPLPAADAPGTAADGGVRTTVSRSSSAVSGADHVAEATDTEQGTPQLPSWPVRHGIPFSTSTGSSSSVPAGAGNAPVASLGAKPGTTAAGTPHVLPSGPRGPTLSNDAVKPPVSPD